jgi:hypothetical protein
MGQSPKPKPQRQLPPLRRLLPPLWYSCLTVGIGWAVSLSSASPQVLSSNPFAPLADDDNSATGSDSSFTYLHSDGRTDSAFASKRSTILEECVGTLSTAASKAVVEAVLVIIVDSGSTEHMWSDRNDFVEFTHLCRYRGRLSPDCHRKGTVHFIMAGHPSVCAMSSVSAPWLVPFCLDFEHSQVVLSWRIMMDAH